MRNLNLNQKAFTGATMLSKAEMKSVMGGVISAETWHQMCLDGSLGGSGTNGNNPVQNEINQAICDDVYENIP